MTTSTRTPQDLRRLKPLVACIGAAALIAMTASFGGDARAADASTPVGLGTADPFAVLAGTALTNVPATTETGPTTITGDIGSTTETIPDVDLVEPSVNHGNSGDTPGARLDLVTAYVEAENAEVTSTIPTELGAGNTLTAGVYDTESGELGLTGTLTLQGDADDVFIFQAGSTLITEVDSRVVLAGEVRACNVFWQVGSSATFKTRSEFVGTVMALTAITAQQGATFRGRLLARNAEVTLDNNTITSSSCPTVGDDTVGDDTVGADDTDGADDTVGDDTVGADDTVGDDTVGDDTVGDDTVGDDTAGADDTVGDDTAGADDTVGDDTAGADDTVGDDTAADGSDVRADRADDVGADVDGADADRTSTDGGTSTGGSTPGSGLPDAGGPSLMLIVAGGLVALTGAALLLARRRPTHRH